MPFVQLPGGRRPIAYDEAGRGPGPAVLHLHGGWGAALYPCDVQAAALRDRARLITPVRSGYGASTPLPELAPGFHQRAAAETIAVMDALDIERAVLWGHSDGAVIAVHAALQAPGRVAGVVLEALHLIADKPGSRAFFTRHGRGSVVGRRARGGDSGRRSRRRPVALRAADERPGVARARGAAAGSRRPVRGPAGRDRPPVLVVHGKATRAPSRASWMRSARRCRTRAASPGRRRPQPAQRARRGARGGAVDRRVRRRRLTPPRKV